MIAKLIVHDADRERARRRMLRALEEFEIGGVKTLVGFHRALLSHPCFVARRDVPRPRRVGGAGAACGGALAAGRRRAAPDGRRHAERAAVEVDGRRVEVDGAAARAGLPRARAPPRGARGDVAPRRRGGRGRQPDAGHGARGARRRGRRGRAGRRDLHRRGDEDGERARRAPRRRRHGPLGRGRRRGRVRPDDLRRLAERRRAGLPTADAGLHGRPPGLLGTAAPHALPGRAWTTWRTVEPALPALGPSTTRRR